jgi:hypothetical protein
MDFVTSGAFLGICAIIVSIIVITTMRKLSVFFMLATTVGFVLFATVVVVTVLALAGVDRFQIDFAHPPV